jgi:polysaccharide export outer membrane protein
MPQVKAQFVVSSCLLWTLAIGSLGAQQPPPPQPPPSTRPASPQQPSTIDPPNKSVGQPVDPNKYVIGPEDVLGITVWREPDLSGVVAVRPDGKITRPFIGEVQAGGVSPAQLTKDLTEKFAVYINRPDVTVIVQEVRSKKYYIDGLVNHPGEFPLVTPTRVFEALSKAGGFQEWAKRTAIRIVRDGGKRIFKFNYKEVTNGKHMEQNIELENGDHIIVN